MDNGSNSGGNNNGSHSNSTHISGAIVNTGAIVEGDHSSVTMVRSPDIQQSSTIVETGPGGASINGKQYEGGITTSIEGEGVHVIGDGTKVTAYRHAEPNQPAVNIPPVNIPPITPGSSGKSLNFGSVTVNHEGVNIDGQQFPKGVSITPDGVTTNFSGTINNSGVMAFGEATPGNANSGQAKSGFAHYMAGGTDIEVTHSSTPNGTNVTINGTFNNTSNMVINETGVHLQGKDGKWVDIPESSSPPQAEKQAGQGKGQPSSQDVRQEPAAEPSHKEPPPPSRQPPVNPPDPSASQSTGNAAKESQSQSKGNDLGDAGAGGNKFTGFIIGKLAGIAEKLDTKFNGGQAFGEPKSPFLGQQAQGNGLVTERYIYLRGVMKADQEEAIRTKKFLANLSSRVSETFNKIKERLSGLVSNVQEVSRGDYLSPSAGGIKVAGQGKGLE